jgi:hypothetical protein
MRIRSAMVAFTAVTAMVVGVTNASPANAATTSARPANATAAHAVAAGPGWVLVGEGAPTGRVASPVALTTLSSGSALARPNTVYDCGWVTCSLYLSRSQTRWLNYNIAVAGGGFAGLGAFCGLMALISNVGAVFVGVGCAAAVAIYGGFILNAITHAAADNGCFRVRYPGLAFYDDHSSFCHNT